MGGGEYAGCDGLIGPRERGGERETFLFARALCTWMVKDATKSESVKG